ncbi:MEDS domain-containing protein [Pseudoduganella violaceinigra]|uniref:MEDS domain-containing protein n=1 Tax=Pseudoduganella violaceinigra TaxID=246602 RepID=UPI0003FC4F49|nr:MEDS domain-containing protein [Pseudoduganella violaceinigra]
MQPAQREAIEEFWQNTAHCDHCVQVYENDSAFLDALEGFVMAGFRQGDAVIVIATPEHREALDRRIERNGIDSAAAAERGQYIVRDARASLARFMFDGWPAEARFHAMVEELLAKARERHPTVRAFGEMVALLWEEKLYRATMRLEHMWTGLCQRESFPLFCAYPKAGFETGDAPPFREVCDAHTRILPPL